MSNPHVKEKEMCGCFTLRMKRLQDTSLFVHVYGAYPTVWERFSRLKHYAQIRDKRRQVVQHLD